MPSGWLAGAGRDKPVAPHIGALGNWRLSARPSSYLRQLPAALAGINLQHGCSHRAEL